MAKRPKIRKDNPASSLVKNQLDGAIIPNKISDPPATLSISLKRAVHSKFYQMASMEPNLTKGEFLDKVLEFYLTNNS